MSQTLKEKAKEIIINDILELLHQLEPAELKELKEHIKRQYAIGGRDEKA